MSSYTDEVLEAEKKAKKIIKAAEKEYKAHLKQIEDVEQEKQAALLTESQEEAKKVLAEGKIKANAVYQKVYADYTRQADSLVDSAAISKDVVASLRDSIISDLISA